MARKERVGGHQTEIVPWDTFRLIWRRVLSLRVWRRYSATASPLAASDASGVISFHA